jgi:ribose transport system substrate-binding protein
MFRRSRIALTAASASLTLLVAGCAAHDDASANAGSEPATSVTYTDAGGLTRVKSPVKLGDTTTRGPDGEVPSWYDTLELTKDEVAKVKSGNYRAAIVWHFTSPFMAALSQGAKQAFEEMGIEVVAETSAEGDDAALQNNIQSALALKPDIMLSIALDPKADAAAFQPAVDAGVKTVFASVKPEGYQAGKDYVSLVTYDLAGLGEVTADALAEGIGGEGDIGFIYYDANFYVTNQREEVAEQTIRANYPDINIVAKEPMADPAKVEDVASAMIAKHPEIKAIFAPWDTAAEGVVAALRQAGRDDVKVYTIDLGNTNALNMASGGMVKEMTSTLATEFGSTMAIAGAYGVLGKEAPEMLIVPAFPVTQDNLAEGWESTFGQTLPTDIASALK